jgi:hypothetical protein
MDRPDPRTVPEPLRVLRVERQVLEQTAALFKLVELRADDGRAKLVVRLRPPVEESGLFYHPW